MNCVIYCTPDGVAVETQDEDSEYTFQTKIVQQFLMFLKQDLPADLRDPVKDKVWDFTGKDIGLIKSAEPVKIQVKPNAILPRIKQYKLSKEAEEDMQPVREHVIDQGILKQVLSSPCNSPVMGIKKPSGK